MTTHGRKTLNPFFYFAKDGGGSSAVIDEQKAEVEAEIAAEKAAAEAEQAEATAQAAKDEADAAEALRIAALEDDDDDEAKVEAEAKALLEKENAEKAETERLATEAAKPKELSEEEFQAEAAKRGFAKAATSEADDLTNPPDVRDFRSEAYAEALKHAQFLTTDADEDSETFGQPILTENGVKWAENRAIQIAAQDVVQSNHTQAQEVQFKAHLEASKPKLIEDTAQHLITEYDAPPESAKKIAEDYAAIAMSYGTHAFDEGFNEPDPVKKAEKAKQAQSLRTHAFYVALGMQAERDAIAKKEGGDAGDKPVEKVNNGGGGTGEGLYAGLSKADIAYIKDEWMPSKNGGKPPTKSQIEHLKKTVFDA